MMPLSLVERVVCALLIVAIAASLGRSLVDFLRPVPAIEQRAEMQPMLDLRQALGLVERGR